MLMRPHILGRCSDEWALLWALHPSLVAYRRRMAVIPVTLCKSNFCMMRIYHAS